MQPLYLFDAWVIEFSLLEFPQPVLIEAGPIADISERLTAIRQQGACFIQQLRCAHGLILSILVLTCQAPMYPGASLV